MILSEAIEKIRERSRTRSSAMSDTRVMQAINEGLNAFSNDVCSSGLHKDDYLTITPKFTTKTNFALRVTIIGGTNALIETDVAITSTARDDVIGTTIASDLQATLRTAIGEGANLTVSWSTTNWIFTIDSIDGTSIIIAAPQGKTYVDATEILGMKRSGAQTLEGEFPDNCTVKTSLPDDFLSIENVMWDDYQLMPAPFDFFTNKKQFGDPSFYHIKNKELFLNPVPTRQESLHVWYKYSPELFTDAETQADTEIPIEQNYQIAIVYWAAFYIADCNFEDKVADRNLALYEQKKNGYIIAKANNNSEFFIKQSPRINFNIDRATL